MAEMLAAKVRFWNFEPRQPSSVSLRPSEILSLDCDLTFMDDTERFHQCLRTLELTSCGSLSEARKAYRELCMIWHPDRHPEGLKHRAGRKIQELNAANEWLQSNQKFFSPSSAAREPKEQSPRIIVAECNRCGTQNRVPLPYYQRPFCGRCGTPLSV